MLPPIETRFQAEIVHQAADRHAARVSIIIPSRLAAGQSLWTFFVEGGRIRAVIDRPYKRWSNPFAFFSANDGVPSKQMSCGSPMCVGKRDLNRNVELRVILLHLVGAVLASEFLDNISHLGLIREGSNFSGPFFSIGLQAHRALFQNVFVPVTIRTLDGQEMKFV